MNNQKTTIKYSLTLLFIGIISLTYGQQSKTKILILGSDHLSQVYHNDYPSTDVFSDTNQKSLKSFNNTIKAFQPDMIGIESTPDQQQEIDSLYQLYLEDKLNLKTVEYGRSEKYQIAFPIGKSSGVDQIACINYKGGTSQSVLDNGDNIQIYKNEGKELGKIVMEKYGQLRQGTLSFKQYLTFLNQPENYGKIYRLRYITPAKVRNGRFKNPDKMIDTAFIDREYIGAELISVFKNRDYKIYSNIVTNQMQKGTKRILIVIGVGHVESLKSIFKSDIDYEVVDAIDYLTQ